jgi:Ca2+-binding EF-hand superfamily protein
MKRITASSFLALALAATASSSAQEGPRAGGADRIGEMIKRLDANADGKVSKEEAVEAGKKEAEERFGKLDANADGVADESELKAMAQKMREGAGRRPEGGDGMRRPGGPQDGAEGGFRRPPEGQSPGAPGGPQGGGFRPEGGPPGGGQGMGFRGMGNPVEMLKNADTNKDAALDKDEFRAMRNKEADEAFGRLDGNADGKITEEEFRQVGERLRAMMGGGDRGGMRRPGQGGPEGGFRRPGGEGGESGGGFRRPPSQEGGDAPKPEGQKPAEAPKGV